MTSPNPPAKKLKKDIGDTDEGRDYDNETQKALEEIDACQNQIDALNEKASEDILKVEQKYNKLRKPYFEKRSSIIRRIPNFWVTALVNHPQITSILDEEEEDCLHYLIKLDVEEFEDIKFGYKLNFYFEPNPYLENRVLTKEFHLGAPDPCSKSTPIRWKEGHDLVKLIRERNNQKQGRKRVLETKSFFMWFEDNCDPSTDEIAEIVKDDLWPNPLQYYLIPDVDVDTGANGVEEDEEDVSDDEADDSVVVVEEVEDDEEDEDDDEVIIEEEDNDDGEGEVEEEKHTVGEDEAEAIFFKDDQFEEEKSTAGEGDGTASAEPVEETTE